MTTDSPDTPPTTGDPIEIAMEAERHDTAVDSPARAVLVGQVGLIASQKRLAEVQIASERAGLVLKGAGALAAGVAAVVLGVMVWDASRASGLVIEPFSVPPTLAERGLTGEVIAAEVQDRITTMQAQTRSSRAEESFETNWRGDISVEIPQTGVSVGELQAWLRGWLGRQTRVGGAVTQTPEGLRVTARVAGRAADTATGAEADLDRTIALAAEALFARTQPYRYGVWLVQNGRNDEASPFFDSQIAVAKGEELAWALTGRALTETSPADRIGLFQRALAVSPNLGLARSNLSSAYQALGRSEAQLTTEQEAARAFRRPDFGSATPDSARVMEAQSGNEVAVLLRDAAESLRFVDQIEALPDFYDSRRRAAGRRSIALATLHDRAGARAAVRAMSVDDATILRLTASTNPQTPYLELAVQEERWADAAPMMEPLRALAIELTGSDPYSLPATAASAARVLTGVGRLDEAEALISTTALNCYDCVLVRAWIAEGRGDRARADHWFSEAVRIGPSLPAAPLEFGRAKLARGDAVGAVTLFREANRRGPRWADPLAYWGEALAAQGDHRGALRKYEAATRIAPRWGRLHLLWSRSLAALGRNEDGADHARMAERLG